MEMAEALFNYVFRNYGLPKNIVSDRGPQLILRVWNSYIQFLGVSEFVIRLPSSIEWAHSRR